MRNPIRSLSANAMISSARIGSAFAGELRHDREREPSDRLHARPAEDHLRQRVRDDLVHDLLDILGRSFDRLSFR